MQAVQFSMIDNVILFVQSFKVVLLNIAVYLICDIITNGNVHLLSIDLIKYQLQRSPVKHRPDQIPIATFTC